jgi:hypothetical protein
MYFVCISVEGLEFENFGRQKKEALGSEEIFVRGDGRMDKRQQHTGIISCRESRERTSNICHFLKEK